ncbi:MAG: hypothetical protein WDN49_14415 [Acetobacteraceae bacterium]
MPTSVIYSVAITTEVWVRAFAPETMLSRVAPGRKCASPRMASPDKAYRGRVGYVSPQAEFTPKDGRDTRAAHPARLPHPRPRGEPG